MTLGSSILNYDQFNIINISGGSNVEIEAEIARLRKCIFCKSEKLRLKDTYFRKLRSASINNKKATLKLKTRKYHCLECSRYFVDRFPGIKKYQRATQAFKLEICDQHIKGISQKQLQTDYGLGSVTTERWTKQKYQKKVSEMINNPTPRILGIDEHYFSKKQGFATTFCDLENHRIYDVKIGRTQISLQSYLNNLPDKDKVSLICIDLSETYRSLAKNTFPNAKIVTDRFHVIKLINHHFLNFWKEINPNGRKNRGLLSLMRRKRENLKPDQIPKLISYLNQFPALKAAYDFKEDLNKLLNLKTKTAKECRKLIPDFFDKINQLRSFKSGSLKILGDTLYSWREEIVRMWRFTKNNGITEGFHNKMELISRRAYGFRNFENYRLRVKALCC